MLKFHEAVRLAAGIALAAMASAAFADDFPCPPDPGAVVLDGNVLVRGPCRLEGTTVIGNVHMYPGGSLLARGARIDGNIQAERADFVDLLETRVEGDIQLDELAREPSRIELVQVGGNIQLKDNRGAIVVLRNTVGADVQAFSNTGGLDFTANDIDGNLQCKSNVPAPTGGDNRVSGNSEDQCARLAPSSGNGDGGGDISGDVHCPPDLGAVTIDGNVLVAAACRMDGTIVKGNVLLYAGGSLDARYAYVDGNIQAERSGFVTVSQVTVKGNIQLDGLVGDLSRIADSRVDGNIQLDDNRSALEVEANEVDGDIQAFGNRGGVLIADNYVDGNLQCKNNSPAPVGGNNRVAGNKEDQCANLQPPPTGSATGGAIGSGSGGSSDGTAAAQGEGSGGGATGPFWLALLGGAWLIRSRTLRAKA
jgi:cytoskeletal protein CcmA (bactofilin family)